MDSNKLKKETFLGVVVDNNDPNKLGRCKVKVFQVFDRLEVDDIPWATPWKDLNGNEFTLPEVGKIVSVVFDQGNKYTPEYIFAQNFNINLERKLKTLSGEDYTTMRAVLMDHSTQIYRNKTEGLKIDHEYTNINLDQYGNILMNLRDNKSIITLGTKDADEEMLLGTTFMSWFDDLVSCLLGAEGGAYIDKTAAPVVASPKLSETLIRYTQLRSKFLSKHLRAPKNDFITPVTREYINQKGDFENAKREAATEAPSSMITNPETGAQEKYDPPTSTTGNPAAVDPNEKATALEYDIPTSENNGKYTSGRVPISERTKSAWLNGDKKGIWVKTQLAGSEQAFLRKDAAQAFDALFDLYEQANFDGKAPILIESGYRSYDEQLRLKKKYTAEGVPHKAAGRFVNGVFVATSNHGFGTAVDFSGIASPNTSLFKSAKARASAYRTPLYKWFFANSWRFGIYNPEVLRDDTGAGDEWWHWEFQGNKGEPAPLAKRYAEPFTQADLDNFKNYGVNRFSRPSKLA